MDTNWQDVLFGNSYSCLLYTSIDVAVYLLLLIITTDIVDYNIAGNSEHKIFHCVGTEHLFVVQQTYKYILG